MPRTSRDGSLQGRLGEQVGIDCNLGGGRKTLDPEMESKLLIFIQNYHNLHKTMPSAKELKNRAILYSNHKHHFKASKGWLEKFMKRNDITTSSRRKLCVKSEDPDEEQPPIQIQHKRIRGKSAQETDRMQISPGSIGSRRTEFQLNQD